MSEPRRAIIDRIGRWTYRVSLEGRWPPERPYGEHYRSTRWGARRAARRLLRQAERHRRYEQQTEVFEQPEASC